MSQKLCQITVQRFHFYITEFNIQFLLHIIQTGKSINNDTVIYLCPKCIPALIVFIKKISPTISSMRSSIVTIPAV